MTTLISFLGKSQLDSKSGYRRARYRFADGSEYETAYFGLALADYLEVDRLILLGTPSSQWDLLVENVVGDTAQEELRIELFDAVRASALSEDLLRLFLPSIERKLGRPMQALIIPHAIDFAEQQTLLARLAEAIARGERVVLDLTHGYRHLAMLGLAAARYLAHARSIVIEGLYYGALDMTCEGVTPAIRLDGLTHVQEWAEAFAAFEASGDFSRFAPLLERDGFPHSEARALGRGWSYLALSNAHDASRQISRVYDQLGMPLSGAAELFRERLRRQLAWSVVPSLAEKQRLLALQALRRGDILRAVIWGLESFITRECEYAGVDALDYQARETIEDGFQQQIRDNEQPEWKRNAYWLLKNIRNACAHGTPPTLPSHAQLMQNPQRLVREIEATLNRLLNTPPR